MKRFFFTTLAVASTLVVASPAGADPPLMVTGAGSSAISGHVVVHAHATGPATDTGIRVWPANGSISVRGSSSGDIDGSVSCIGLLFPGRAIVSGTLDAPVVSGGSTFPHFSLVVEESASGPGSWIGLFITNLAALGGPGECGAPLFFSASLTLPEALPNILVTKGRFHILGDS
jgi:hypothetical protein